MYQNSPRKIVENFGLKWSKYKNQVLGGEAAMWSEQVILKTIFNESLEYQNKSVPQNFILFFTIH